MSSSKFERRRQQVLMRYPVTQALQLKELPALKTFFTALSQENLFVAKLRQCCTLFDFRDPIRDLRSKEIKRAALNNILSYIHFGDSVLSEKIYPEIFEMVSQNIFRSLRPSKSLSIYTKEEDDQSILEPAWEHFELVYGILSVFLESPHFRLDIAQNFINEKFISQIIQLFNSEDPREREALQLILHCLYRQFLPLRTCIRETVSNVFFGYIYEEQHFNGIVDLLQVLGSIAKGFSVPLKEHHKTFLMKVLLPLNKTKDLHIFCDELTYCVVKCLEKDSALTGKVVTLLLRLWPKTCPSKEVYFLGELEHILKVVTTTEFEKIQRPVFRQVAKCVSSPDHLVANQAFHYWDVAVIRALIEANISAILPIMFPALYETSRSHWDKCTVISSNKVLKFFSILDSRLFDEALENYRNEQENEQLRTELCQKFDELAINQN